MAGTDPAGKWQQITMEEVLRRDNMLEAFQRVTTNKGAPGIDGMTVDDLGTALRVRWTAIREELLTGRYHPQPVRKVDIPKPGGKGMRTLGIPTVIDRLIQQSLLQTMQPFYDATFSTASYGFRPGRSAHQAVEAARSHIADGFDWVVDMDLEKFFDRVNHDVLMARLARRITDKRILLLIRRFLTAGMMEEGLVTERTQGTPQGGPLSPLLSNILLDELDRELERRGHRFVRYADDCNLYVRSQAAGERVMNSVEWFLKDRLRLTVNRDKSAVDRPWNRKFLGFSFTRTGPSRIKVAPESLKRLRSKVQEVVTAGRGRRLGDVVADLAPMLRGWMAYYRKAETKTDFDRTDQWLRRKLRCILWRQWKTAVNRCRELTARGLDRKRTKLATGNGRGPWWNAGASHMRQGVPNTFFRKLGLVSLLDVWLLTQNTS
jgi:RNA-directed DNA polymerase